MRFLATAGVVVGLLLPLYGQQPQRQQPYVLSVNVDLVVLNVRVLDRNGQSVPNLSKENFRIEEDGKPQKISLFIGEDSPATIGLVMDASGSIAGKRPEIEAAAMRFVESSHPKDEMFVVHFDQKVRWGLPRGMAFTDDVHVLKQAIRWTQPGGKTALYDAIAEAIEHIALGRWDKRALVVLSDGGDNASVRKLDDILRLAQQSNVTIYTIGLFDPYSADRDPHVLRKLAELTGGDVYLPESIKELNPAWEKIAHGIRAQYTIAYRPVKTAFDGRYHKIRVRVDWPGHKKISIHTRPGYLARKAAGER